MLSNHNTLVLFILTLYIFTITHIKIANNNHFTMKFNLQIFYYVFIGIFVKQIKDNERITSLYFNQEYDQ